MFLFKLIVSLLFLFQSSMLLTVAHGTLALGGREEEDENGWTRDDIIDV